MFNWLFSKKQKQLTKFEYYEKWDFYGLLDDLHVAEKMLKNKTGGHTGDFDSVEQFKKALEDEIDWIEYNNKTNLTQIHQWFLPTGVWIILLAQKDWTLATEFLKEPQSG